MGDHIFISYSHKNLDYVNNLVEELDARQIPFFMDAGIDYGDDWWDRIVAEIKSCLGLVVVMTPQAEASRWIKKELLLADKFKKTIFPLLLAGEEFSMLIDKQFVDVSGGQLPPEDFYKKLRQVISPSPARPDKPASQKPRQTKGDLMADIEFLAENNHPDTLLNCPLCQVEVKAKNIVGHARKVHPAAATSQTHRSAGMRPIRVSTAGSPITRGDQIQVWFHKGVTGDNYTMYGETVTVWSTDNKGVPIYANYSDREPIGYLANRTQGRYAGNRTEKALSFWISKTDLIDIPLGFRPNQGFSAPRSGSGDGQQVVWVLNKFVGQRKNLKAGMRLTIIAPSGRVPVYASQALNQVVAMVPPQTKGTYTGSRSETAISLLVDLATIPG